MRDNHIIRQLDEKPIADLSADESAAIDLHVAQCSECRLAYDAARVSVVLIRERVAEVIEVAPFFKTRVMAELRARQLSPEGPALLKMWRAARAVVSVMATLVVILMAMTIFSQNSEPQLSAEPDSASIYSAEYVLLEEGDLEGEGLLYDQVIETIYDGEDADEQ